MKKIITNALIKFWFKNIYVYYLLRNRFRHFNKSGMELLFQLLQKETIVSKNISQQITHPRINSFEIAEIAF